jgi:hypothetical protein
MTAAVITASASVVVAVLAFLLNQRAAVRSERRRAQLERVHSQLRELYGPLQALVDVNERLWDALHDTGVRDETKHERPGGDVDDAAQKRWDRWLDRALMPANVRMRDLIMANADLVIESGMPEPLLGFCAHVAASEVALAKDSFDVPGGRRSIIRHPGNPYIEYVRTSFQSLKAQQALLLTEGRLAQRKPASQMPVVSRNQSPPEYLPIAGKAD